MIFPNSKLAICYKNGLALGSFTGYCALPIEPCVTPRIPCMNRHLSQIEKGRWPDFLKGPLSQHYTSASIFEAKGGALFEVEKGRQLA